MTDEPIKPGEQTPPVENGSDDVLNLRKELEARLIEQDHRIFSVISNFWRYRMGPSEYRRASTISAGALLARFLITGSILGGFGIVAILGLTVAMRSNYLLEQQNLKIDQQTLLVDAQRRASLNIEISSIWEQLRVEAPSGTVSKAFVPSNVLTARVVALTRAFSPYTYLLPQQGADDGIEIDPKFFERIFPLENGSKLLMENTPLSPERGQLLVALTSIGADVSFMSARGATFAFSDLRGQMLSFPRTEMFDLTGADFSGSVLWRTDFTGSILTETKFDCVYFEHAVFGFNGSPFFATDATFRYTFLGEFIVGPHDDNNSAPSTYFIHNAIFGDFDLSDSLLSGLSFVGYDSLDELPLPKSFDHERYSIVEENQDFVVVANNPEEEALKRQESYEHCSRYNLMPDPRLARVMWGSILDGEWRHWE